MAWRVLLWGNGLEHNAVHSQYRRISYKRKGDDAPPVFGIRLADTRIGERRRTGAVGVIEGVISVIGERAETALSGQGGGVIEKVSNIRKVRKTMKKPYAIQKVNDHLGERLLKGSGRNSNTRFSNINSRYPVWWFTISPQKFGNELHLLCAKRQGLIWLRLDADAILNPTDMFSPRSDGDVDVEICCDASSPRYMHDVRIGGKGYDFRPHIEYEWDED